MGDTKLQNIVYQSIIILRFLSDEVRRFGFNAFDLPDPSAGQPQKHVAGTHLGYVTAKELCSTLTDSRIIGLNQSGKCTTSELC